MKVRCPKGHEFLSNYGAFKQGKGCKVCGIARAAASRKIPEHHVRDSLEARGYEMLAPYTGNLRPLSFRCPQGHQGEMTWASFQDGHGCRECSFSIRGAVKSQNTGKRAAEKFEAEGYRMISPYKSAHGLIDFICPKGHQHSMSWTNFDSGMRCLYCSSTNRPVTQEKVDASFSDEGFKLMDKYKNKKKKMRFICPEGHEHSISWDNWNAGNRCGICSGRYLSEEQIQINRLKYNCLKLVQRAIREGGIMNCFAGSKSAFASRTAEQVFAVLGARPEGAQLDHIVPQSFFDFRNQAEIESCWRVENLRWLGVSQNASRGNRLTQEEVRGFSKELIEILRSASLKPSRFNHF